MPLDGARDFLDRLQARSDGPAVPSIENELGPVSGWAAVDVLEREPDGVKLVEGDFSFGKVFRDALHVGSAHVNTCLLDAGGVRVVIVDMVCKPSNSLRIIASGDVDDLPGVHVDE